jgi:hypothetical protein
VNISCLFSKSWGSDVHIYILPSCPRRKYEF